MSTEAPNALATRSSVDMLGLLPAASRRAITDCGVHALGELAPALVTSPAYRLLQPLAALVAPVERRWYVTATISRARLSALAPPVRSEIAKVYGLDFWDLLYQAGWPIPHEEPKGAQRWLGSPLRDLMDLSDGEMEELLDFAGYLRKTSTEGAGQQVSDPWRSRNQRCGAAFQQ